MNEPSGCGFIAHNTARFPAQDDAAIANLHAAADTGDLVAMQGILAAQPQLGDHRYVAREIRSSNLCLGCPALSVIHFFGRLATQGGATALHICAEKGHTECVKFLLDLGVDTDSLNHVRATI